MKALEEILAKSSHIPIEDIQFKYECEIIRPSEAISAMEEFGRQQYNQAIKDAVKNAEGYYLDEVRQEMPARVNQESILKLLK